jgi:hypothetical protein
VNDAVVDEQEQGSSAETSPSARPSKSVSRQPGKRVDYQGKAKLLMDRCIADARNNQARLDRDRQDWQNLLFYRGGQNQWSVYDRATNSYVPRGTDPEQGGLPEWVPRPVTNLFGIKVDGIVSLLNQSEPAKLWSPSTDDDADRATAEVAADADPVLLQEIGYDKLRPQLNKLAVADQRRALIAPLRQRSRSTASARSPCCAARRAASRRCPTSSMTPATSVLARRRGAGCGTPADAFEPVIGSDGVPFGIPYAKGKMCGTLATSFEYSIPSTARTTDTKDSCPGC